MPPKKYSKKLAKQKDGAEVQEAPPMVLKIPRAQPSAVVAAAPPILAFHEEEEEETDSDPQENPYANQDLNEDEMGSSEDDEDSDGGCRCRGRARRGATRQG